MEEFSLKVDDLELKGKLFKNPSNKTPKAGILFIHGWESQQDRNHSFAETLAEKGYYCATVDLRGHGISEGDHKKFSREDFLKDAVAAYDFLIAQENIEADKIVVIGSSFGSYIAALLSTKREVSALVLRAPADYLDEGFNKPLYEQRQQFEHTKWKESPHTPDETAALRAIHNFSGQILIIESGADDVVPKATVRSYENAAPDKNKLSYVVMENAPHSISRQPEFQREFNNIVFSWLG